MGMLPDDFEKMMEEIFEIIAKGIHEIAGMDMMFLDILGKLEEFGEYLSNNKDYLSDFMSFMNRNRDRVQEIVVFEGDKTIQCNNLIYEYAKKHKEDYLKEIERLHSAFLMSASFPSIAEMIRLAKKSDIHENMYLVILGSFLMEFIEYEGLMILVPILVKKTLEYDIPKVNKIAEEYVKRMYDVIYKDIAEKKDANTKMIDLSEETINKMDEIMQECVSKLDEKIGYILLARKYEAVFDDGEGEDN